MEHDRALFWMGICILMMLGLILGQAAAVGVGAMAGVLLAYNGLKSGSGSRRQSEMEISRLSPE